MLLFESVADRAKPYYKTQARLARFLTVPVRNDSLYYNSRTGTLPQDVYNNVWAQQALNVVRHFVLEVGQEVK